jgi:hypothetical protein
MASEILEHTCSAHYPLVRNVQVFLPAIICQCFSNSTHYNLILNIGLNLISPPYQAVKNKK